MNRDDVEVFVEAARAGSLSEAARRLGVTPAVASKRLAVLERESGVRLMHRSTRKLALTREGEAFLPAAQAVLDAHESARATLASGRAGARGIIRLTAPITFGSKVLWPLLPKFLHANPDLEADLQLSDQVMDLYEGSIDAAIRIAPLADTRLIAKALSANPMVLCAAPQYVSRHGTPSSTEELGRHQCLAFGGATQWSFGEGKSRRSVRVHGRVRSNNYEVIRGACLSGYGIMLSSRWDVHDDIARRVLIEVKLGIDPTALRVWLVYPTRSPLPLRLSLLFEHLVRTVPIAMRGLHTANAR
jgi:DNA-binding transcriptional LysR family regulator